MTFDDMKKRFDEIMENISDDELIEYFTERGHITKSKNN